MGWIALLVMMWIVASVLALVFDVHVAIVFFAFLFLTLCGAGVAIVAAIRGKF